MGQQRAGGPCGPQNRPGARPFPGWAGESGRANERNPCCVQACCKCSPSVSLLHHLCSFTPSPHPMEAKCTQLLGPELMKLRIASLLFLSSLFLPLIPAAPAPFLGACLFFVPAQAQRCLHSCILAGSGMFLTFLCIKDLSHILTFLEQIT